MSLKVARPALASAPTPHAVASAILASWDDADVVHVAGVQPDADLRTFYDTVVESVGEPAAVAEDATIDDRDRQAIGERWMEVRFDPRIPDAYRHSANAQPLHTDGSYIPDYPNATLMYCVAAAPEGGETVFLAGRTLVDVLSQKNPDLLARLRSTPIPHSRSGLRRTTVMLDEDAAGPLLNWNYYCVDPACTDDVRGLRDELFEFLASPHIAGRVVGVPLAPGEAVVWKDRRVLHGRNAFSANAASERFIWKCGVDVGRRRSAA